MLRVCVELQIVKSPVKNNKLHADSLSLSKYLDARVKPMKNLIVSKSMKGGNRMGVTCQSGLKRVESRSAETIY